MASGKHKNRVHESVMLTLQYIVVADQHVTKARGWSWRWIWSQWRSVGRSTRRILYNWSDRWNNLHDSNKCMMCPQKICGILWLHLAPQRVRPRRRWFEHRDTAKGLIRFHRKTATVPIFHSVQAGQNEQTASRETIYRFSSGREIKRCFALPVVPNITRVYFFSWP